MLKEAQIHTLFRLIIWKLWEKLFSTDTIKGLHETCVSSAIPMQRPRCKCVHLYFYNLKPETFFFLSLPLLSAGGRSRPDSIWGEVVDHESVSPFGNKFDIRLEVRTQNGSVVRKSKMLLYLPFQLQFHIIAQTFFWSYHFFWLFLTFSLLPPFSPPTSKSSWIYLNFPSWSSDQLHLQDLLQHSRFAVKKTEEKGKLWSYCIFSFYKIKFLWCQ